MIWFRSANSLQARSSIAASEAGQMAASDNVANPPKKPLALGGASTDEYPPQLAFASNRWLLRPPQSYM